MAAVTWRQRRSNRLPGLEPLVDPVKGMPETRSAVLPKSYRAFPTLVSRCFQKRVLAQSVRSIMGATEHVNDRETRWVMSLESRRRAWLGSREPRSGAD